MKKSLLFVVLLGAIAFTTHAQEFKKFKGGIGLGYASAFGDGASGGVLFYLEPAYRVSDQLAVGLRLESALIVRGITNYNSSTADLDISAIGSYTVNGQYYFSNNTFRPFAGLGFGLYSLAAISVEDAGNNGGTVEAIEAASKFGFYTRVGFDAGHFTLQLEYNLIPKSTSTVNNVEIESQNSYLAIKAGFFFGGGKK